MEHHAVPAIDGGNEQRALMWRPGLDGLRGVAIVLVFLFHLDTRSIFPGGSFGVDLFFVLSGFLITTLLLQERNRTDSINLPLFYLRRAARLLPLFLVFCLVFASITLPFTGERFTQWSTQSNVLMSLAYGLTYVINWPIALGGNVPLGFSHVWSLSVEEQFYVLWPGALAIMLHLRLRPIGLLFLTLCGISLSASMPVLLPDTGWLRLYFGSDFRAQELLIGCLVGQLYVFRVLRESWFAGPVFGMFLGLSIAVFLVLVVASNNKAIVMYQGGYTVLAIASAVMVLGAAFRESGTFARLLSSPILSYLGRRSYALYLWHFPISLWLNQLGGLEQFLLAALASLAAAELSYRLVERPSLRLRDRFLTWHRARGASSTRIDPPAAGWVPEPRKAS